MPEAKRLLNMPVSSPIAANDLANDFLYGDTVASATSITPTGAVFHVSGTTAITSMVGTGLPKGFRCTLIFDSTPTFTDGNNLKLAGNLVATADDTITVVWDGSNWYEVSRSVN